MDHKPRRGHPRGGQGTMPSDTVRSKRAGLMETGPLAGCRCYSILPYAFYLIPQLASGHTSAEGDLPVERLYLVLYSSQLGLK
jgi:hypothetical protein